MPCWFLTTARPSTRMTLKWARQGTSCAASLRAAGRNFIRENRPICEARKVGVTLWHLPTFQTKTCRSHLLMAALGGLKSDNADS